ncbi:MAG: tetratricopeptide repeat protein, partial [Chloroflexota bacterium]|nr:tetratricopeptide repeat protein [Chloroflexota bacterium]
MDNDLFLSTLRELSLEEGCAYIQSHRDEITDVAVTGNLLADDALAQLYVNPATSLKLSEVLIFFGEFFLHKSSHALGLKAKGDALRVRGLHQAAIECLDEAGEEFLSLNDEKNWAHSRISWILAAAWLGRVDDALQEASRAREVFRRLGDDYWACVVDHNTAMIYDNMGRYQEALDLYEDTLTIYPTLIDKDEILIKRAIAIAQFNRALILAKVGAFEQSYVIQQQAQEIFIALNETSSVVTSEIEMADLDYTQGYYGSALHRYYHALDLLLKNNVDNPLVLSELKFWMAKCLLKLNRTQEAYNLANEAVAVHRQLGTSLQVSNI